MKQNEREKKKNLHSCRFLFIISVITTIVIFVRPNIRLTIKVQIDQKPKIIDKYPH